MRDELDGQLLQCFRAGQRPLADAQFVDQVRERLHVYSVQRLLGVVLSGVVRAVGAGLSFGIVAPLRMRHAGLLALTALGIALWSLVRRSL